MKKVPALALITLTVSIVFGQSVPPAKTAGPATAGKNIAGQAKSKSGGHDAQQPRQRIELYERELIESERKHDWDAIARRLAPDFLEIAGDGKAYNKEQVAAYFPDVRLHSYTISEMEVRILDVNAAIVAYKIEVDASFKGRPVPGAVRVSSVWARQRGAWMMKFHQATPIPQ
jgi:hypothetical protein